MSVSKSKVKKYAIQAVVGLAEAVAVAAEPVRAMSCVSEE
jgi:hypothetical protein